MEDKEKEEKVHYFTFDDIINSPMLDNTKFRKSDDDKESSKGNCDSESEKEDSETDTDPDTDIEINPHPRQKNTTKQNFSQFVEELNNNPLSDVNYEEWYNEVMLDRPRTSITTPKKDAPKKVVPETTTIVEEQHDATSFTTPVIPETPTITSAPAPKAPAAKVTPEKPSMTAATPTVKNPYMKGKEPTLRVNTTQPLPAEGGGAFAAQ